ncbi:N-acetylmuramoyl-L-alanine amidase [Pseudobacteroides sp.]|uniref:N-acetylmuramoyl-L-alanine amidase n=1 Tax=Pseudobacteroides sp. TaxID=1968840 RepID=UPI0039C8E036
MPPHNRVIVIDPGHGGIDGGASINNLLEKYINLDTSRKIKTVQEALNSMVIDDKKKTIHDP